MLTATSHSGGHSYPTRNTKLVSPSFLVGVRGDVELGDSVWVGAMAILLPGTKIGKGSIVGAGSVVQGEFPPFSVSFSFAICVRGDGGLRLLCGSGDSRPPRASGSYYTAV